MHRHTRQAVIRNNVVHHNIAVRLVPGCRSKQPHPRARAWRLPSVVVRHIAIDRIVKHSSRRRRPRRKERMRSQRDPAIERIVLHRVSHDQIVMRCARVVTQQNPARVILDQIIRDDRVIHAAQMNSLAAVEPLIRLKRRNVRAFGGVDIQIDIVLQNVIARDRNVRGVGNEDALEVRILHFEARHRNPFSPGLSLPST